MLFSNSRDRSYREDAYPRQIILLLILIFFFWGAITSLNDVIIPKLKLLYHLSYKEAMLMQFSFFMGYLFVSLPAGALVSTVGQLRGLSFGLLVIAFGAAMFWPCAIYGEYWPFLTALFIIAGGIAITQVAGNPLMAMLGDPALASSRLTLAQGFSSLGMAVAPWAASAFLLAPVFDGGPAIAGHAGGFFARGAGETDRIAVIYVALSFVVIFVAAAIWALRGRISTSPPKAIGIAASIALLSDRKTAFGVLALFTYVGAEVSIGSMMVSYLELPRTMDLDFRSAGNGLALHWTGAMLGRFAGAALLRKIEAGRLLGLFAGINMVLLFLSMTLSGNPSGWSLIAVGLFNSIMFPTIFALTLRGLGSKAAEGAGLLCMAIVGGAIIPLATGAVADALSLTAGLCVPFCCYGVIAAFGFRSSKPTVGVLPDHQVSC